MARYDMARGMTLVAQYDGSSTYETTPVALGGMTTLAVEVNVQNWLLYDAGGSPNLSFQAQVYMSNDGVAYKQMGTVTATAAGVFIETVSCKGALAKIRFVLSNTGAAGDWSSVTFDCTVNATAPGG